MKVQLSLLLLAACTTFTAHAAEGLVKKASAFSVTETADRLEALVNEKKLTFFTRIDHAANAENADLSLRPTETLIFGNPKVGTPLMHCAQSVAIDLPQKVLVWEDEEGQVWLGYNDPDYLKARHGIEGCDKYLKKIGTVLSNLSEQLTNRKN
ncbi:DUF302 domain-containing protein [Alteromonas sp. ASW11-19]|uniref:DUF302 domain-containing protein n=1 Tax=Alteromonas salexigens TaxID=2982530 RepID=A0ABT2VPZ9_9ALTE|nr:DUF302 domain-containing protein [Alteromonas salexigens]MCU7555391.1 DUF302 domain-containing protein [Alteromonas salexigens]